MANDDIQGQITDSAGNAVQGATVYLFKQGSPNQVASTTTDSSGNYIFYDHPDGDGTTAEWYVTAYYDDGTNLYNTLSKPSVSAQLSTAIPDSVVHQFVGANATDSGDWTSEDGSFTLSATGSPTVQSGVLNGEDVVYYDGSSYHASSLPSSLSQPYAISAVYRYETFGQTGSRAVGDTSSNHACLDPDNANGDFRIQGENSISGSDGHTNWVIHSGYFDGTNSESRIDGTTDASGDVGSNTMDNLNVAYLQSSDISTEFSHAEILVYDNPTLSDVQDGESYLNGKYGVY